MRRVETRKVGKESLAKKSDEIVIRCETIVMHRARNPREESTKKSLRERRENPERGMKVTVRTMMEDGVEKVTAAENAREVAKNRERNPRATTTMTRKPKRANIARKVAKAKAKANERRANAAVKARKVERKVTKVARSAIRRRKTNIVIAIVITAMMTTVAVRVKARNVMIGVQAAPIGVPAAPIGVL